MESSWPAAPPESSQSLCGSTTTSVSSTSKRFAASGGRTPWLFCVSGEAAGTFQLPGMWMNADELYALLLSRQVLARSGEGVFNQALGPLQPRIHALLGERAFRLDRLHVPHAHDIADAAHLRQNQVYGAVHMPRTDASVGVPRPRAQPGVQARPGIIGQPFVLADACPQPPAGPQFA